MGLEREFGFKIRGGRVATGERRINLQTGWKPCRSFVFVYFTALNLTVSAHVPFHYTATVTSWINFPNDRTGPPSPDQLQPDWLYCNSNCSYNTRDQPQHSPASLSSGEHRSILLLVAPQYMTYGGHLQTSNLLHPILS